MVLTKPDSGPASLISIPRDSYVEVDGKGAKINSVAELYGYPKLVTAVEGITGQKIDHVVSVGFGGLQTIVDALGGVELCYDRTVNDEKSGLNWTAGCHTASGTTALAMSRMRYSDPEGDFGRTKRQRMVISAIIKKAASPAVAANPFTLQKDPEIRTFLAFMNQKTSTLTMVRMALAFRSATREGGVTGTAIIPARITGRLTVSDPVSGLRTVQPYAVFQTGKRYPACRDCRPGMLHPESYPQPILAGIQGVSSV